MTTHTPPRPTSSPPRPAPRDDLPQVTSSLVPLPTGGRGHRSRPAHTHTTSSTSSPGRGQNYNPTNGDIGTCQTCGRTIHWGQPYMPRIPFLGAWRGFSHQHCPPALVVVSRSSR